MKEHEVNIELAENGRLVANPQHTQAVIGDVIRWRSEHGDVTLHFQAGSTPFTSSTVHGGEEYTALRSGTFSYRCTLKKRETREVIDWPEDGADVEISTRGI